MELCCCWTPVWSIVFLLRTISAEKLILSQTTASFTEAAARCAPGVLTSVSTEQEVQQILELLNSLEPHQEEISVWVGLKKVKNECVVQNLPLKGYKWIEDGSQETKINMWVEEPKLTCTEVRCAAIRQGFLQSSARLGLVPVSCKTKYRFICKPKHGLIEVSHEHRPATRTPALEPELDRRTTRSPAAEPEPPTPETRLATLDPSPAPLQTHSPIPRHRTESGAGSIPVPESDPCQIPNVPGSRYFSLDDKNSSRIQLECWSTIRMDLFCLGQPIMWRVLDGSPANLSHLCQHCSTGYQKDASGHCVDVDECSKDGVCPHTCINTPGSYSCVCGHDIPADHDNANGTDCEVTGVATDEDPLWDILVPVLVAVGVLLVLLLVIGVTVKCCMRRRSKKLNKEDEDEEDKRPMRNNQ
ncbi:C-type lectin domain family 14 member A [Cololabis saira]|uniref:C-type lectin domain family 14 member A n=1 Tax=Cololabis saira TaxID=129043 RepID=UPI002AD4F480|nr:C-type lectin domain family 14 member A [Cololabis saira]